MKKQVATAIGITVVICAVFWLYTEWELKSFKETLPGTPPVQVTSETSGTQQKGVQVRTVPSSQVPDAGLETVTPTDRSFDSATVAETPIDDLTVETFFDTFPEETARDEVTSGDFTDVPQEVLYDVALVEKGFADYNSYLDIAPEYAYKRLDDALREQYGDDPDVDLVVETVRRSNEGTLTVDEAIHHAEAMMRLVSKISPPEAVAVMAENLEYFREVKQLSLESGEDTVHYFNMRFHFGE